MTARIQILASATALHTYFSTAYFAGQQTFGVINPGVSFTFSETRYIGGIADH
ncbi:MAG: hypothetical protein AAGH78_13025 [Cyanobacteria bacterium P01_H01_bin.58]